MAAEAEKLGMKKLTLENWLEPDSIMRVFVQWDEDGVRPVAPSDWARPILSVELTSEVPMKVRRMFEVARGCLLYGCMFYPLFSLGWQQLYRVLDAAAYHKCEQLGMKQTKNTTFHGRLLFLEERSLLAGRMLETWHSSRRLRNFTSHEVSQSIVGPGDAVGHLRRSAEMINSLFEST